MNPQDKDPKYKFFRGYVADKKILIADTSAVSRAGVSNILVSMGAVSTNIVLASSYQEAETEIAKHKPKVVICDYDLGTRCGLELIQKQKQQQPGSKDTLFILVTGNTSQTAVARAAEEDVDTYVIKPFTTNILRDSIIKAALTKLRPSPYLQKIEEGKAQLLNGQVDHAIQLFEEAVTLDPAPSLALGYLGQANWMKQALSKAEGSYQKGLSYNKIHYKCLVGLFDVLMAEKRFEDAYDVVKKLSQYFPANPQRLGAVLRLAIITKSYEDVEKFYQTFTKIDDRNDEVIRYVCAALVVCGKHYLNSNHKLRALELFKKAAITASGRTKVLQEIILALIDAGIASDAREYLQRFPSDQQSTPLYLGLEFLILDRASNDPSITIARGRQLLNQGVHDPLIYEVMIRRCVEAEIIQAETLLAEAIKRWPERQDAFKKLAI